MKSHPTSQKLAILRHHRSMVRISVEVVVKHQSTRTERCSVTGMFTAQRDDVVDEDAALGCLGVDGRMGCARLDPADQSPVFTVVTNPSIDAAPLATALDLDTFICTEGRVTTTIATNNIKSIDTPTRVRDSLSWVLVTSESIEESPPASGMESAKRIKNYRFKI
jgi:hypothetical protein